MSHHQAARGAAEAAVREQGYGLAQARAYDRGSDAEHLPHAGPASRTLVTNHEHVSVLDVSAGDRVHGGLFVLEDLGRAAMPQVTAPGHLHDTALRGEVALQDDQAAGWLDRGVQGANHVLTRRLDSSGTRLGERLASHGDLRAVRETAFHQAPRDQLDPARLVDVRGDVLAARLEIHEQRSALADGIEIVDAQFHAAVPGEGEKVQHGVCRTAGRGDARNRVLESGAIHDVRRSQVRLECLHQHEPSAIAGIVLARIDRRNARRAHRGDADHLHRRRHRVGCVLTAASPGSRTGVILDFEQFGIADLARGVRSDSFEDILNRDVDPVDLAGQDRPSVKEH